NGESIEKAPLETYLGRATVVDLAQAFLDSKEKHLITIEDLRPSAEAIAATSRLLVKTGRWSDSAVFPNQIPVIAADVPAWLQKNGVKLLGMDLPSVDEIDSKSLQNHHAQQAYTSFEMIKEGRWFYQQTPHERVATKPPLVGWLSAGLFAMTRLWELSWRLPSLLAAVALAVLLFRTASAAYGSIAGLVALSALGLNLLTPRLATLVRTDMALAFVILLVGLLICQEIERQEE